MNRKEAGRYYGQSHSHLASKKTQNKPKPNPKHISKHSEDSYPIQLDGPYAGSPVGDDPPHCVGDE